MRTTKIRLTAINEERIGLRGAYLDIFFKNAVRLRKARNVGDEEVVNNFVLGTLNFCKEMGMLDFERI